MPFLRAALIGKKSGEDLGEDKRKIALTPEPEPEPQSGVEQPQERTVDETPGDTVQPQEPDTHDDDAQQVPDTHDEDVPQEPGTHDDEQQEPGNDDDDEQPQEPGTHDDDAPQEPSTHDGDEQPQEPGNDDEDEQPQEPGNDGDEQPQEPGNDYDDEQPQAPDTHDEDEQPQGTGSTGTTSTGDYSGSTLRYDVTSGQRYVDKVSTKTEFDKMLDELAAISNELLTHEVEKFALKFTSKFQGEADKAEADARKFEAFLGGYIANAAMILYDHGYRDAALKKLDQARSIIEAKKRLEEEAEATRNRVEENNDSVDLTDILGLFGD